MGITKRCIICSKEFIDEEKLYPNFKYIYIKNTCSKECSFELAKRQYEKLKNLSIAN